MRWRVAWFFVRDAQLAPYLTLFAKGYLRISWQSPGRPPY